MFLFSTLLACAGSASTSDTADHTYPEAVQSRDYTDSREDEDDDRACTDGCPDLDDTGGEHTGSALEDGEQRWHIRRDLTLNGRLDESADTFKMIIRSFSADDCIEPPVYRGMVSSCLRGVYGLSEENNSEFTGYILNDSLLSLTQIDGGYLNQITGYHVEEGVFEGTWLDASDNRGDFVLWRVED